MTRRTVIRPGHARRPDSPEGILVCLHCGGWWWNTDAGRFGYATHIVDNELPFTSTNDTKER